MATVNGWRTKDDIIYDLAMMTGRVSRVDESCLVYGERPPPLRDTTDFDEEIELMYGKEVLNDKNSIDCAPDLKGIKHWIQTVNNAESKEEDYLASNDLLVISKLNPNVPEFVPHRSISSQKSETKPKVEKEQLIQPINKKEDEIAKLKEKICKTPDESYTQKLERNAAIASLIKLNQRKSKSSVASKKLYSPDFFENCTAKDFNKSDESFNVHQDVLSIQQVNNNAVNTQEIDNTDNNNVIEPTTSLKTNDHQIIEPTTSLKTNDHHIIEPTTSLKTNDHQIIEPTTSLKTNDHHIIEPTTSLKTNDHQIIEPTTSLKTNDHHIIEPTLLKTNDHQIIEPTTSLKTNDHHIIEPTLLKTNDHQIIEPTTSLKTNDHHIIEPTLLKTNDHQIIEPTTLLKTNDYQIDNNEETTLTPDFMEGMDLKEPKHVNEISEDAKKSIKIVNDWFENKQGSKTPELKKNLPHLNNVTFKRKEVKSPHSEVAQNKVTKPGNKKFRPSEYSNTLKEKYAKNIEIMEKEKCSINQFKYTL